MTNVVAGGGRDPFGWMNLKFGHANHVLVPYPFERLGNHVAYPEHPTNVLTQDRHVVSKTVN